MCVLEWGSCGSFILASLACCPIASCVADEDSRPLHSEAQLLLLVIPSDASSLALSGGRHYYSPLAPRPVIAPGYLSPRFWMHHLPPENVLILSCLEWQNSGNQPLFCLGAAEKKQRPCGSSHS